MIEYSTPRKDHERRVVNTYHTFQDLDGLGVGFLAVLVEHGPALKPAYTVYGGIVRLPDHGPGEDQRKSYSIARERGALLIAARGDSMTFARARTFYPALPEESYVV